MDVEEFEQVLTSTSWLANTQRPNWRSFLTDGYLFSVLGIYIWKFCFVSQAHCWCLLRGLDHIYEPKPNAKKDEIIDCWISVLILKKNHQNNWWANSLSSLLHYKKLASLNTNYTTDNLLKKCKIVLKCNHSWTDQIYQN